MSDDAIPAGMKPWAGGGAAPADWDGGPVLFRDGTEADDEDMDAGWSWDHGHLGADIIAYTPAPVIVRGSDERAREVLDCFMHAAEPILSNERDRWDPDEWMRRLNKLTVGDWRALHAALAASRPTDAGAGEDKAFIFDVLEALKPHFPEIAFCFARGTGGIERQGILAILNGSSDADESAALNLLRSREMQAIGAAISNRNWHDLESAYNQGRDRLDGILTARKLRERRA